MGMGRLQREQRFCEPSARRERWRDRSGNGMRRRKPRVYEKAFKLRKEKAERFSLNVRKNDTESNLDARKEEGRAWVGGVHSE